jgi:hypothetical protein
MRLSRALVCVALFVSIIPSARAQYVLMCSGSPADISRGVETPFIIMEGSGAHLKFQYAGVEPVLNSPPTSSSWFRPAERRQRRLQSV